MSRPHGGDGQWNAMHVFDKWLHGRNHLWGRAGSHRSIEPWVRAYFSIGLGLFMNRLDCLWKPMGLEMGKSVVYGFVL